VRSKYANCDSEDFDRRDWTVIAVSLSEMNIPVRIMLVSMENGVVASHCYSAGINFPEIIPGAPSDSRAALPGYTR
jgi:hypothetical protein